MLRGLDPGTVVLQCPMEDNGQWEPRGKQISGALAGRLRVVYARKRMEKKFHDAVLVGGTPAQLKRMAEGLVLVFVWPARKTTRHPAAEDQNLVGLLKRLRMPLHDWTVAKIERMEA
jgi:hypothetical protein